MRSTVSKPKLCIKHYIILHNNVIIQSWKIRNKFSCVVILLYISEIEFGCNKLAPLQSCLSYFSLYLHIIIILSLLNKCLYLCMDTHLWVYAYISNSMFVRHPRHINGVCGIDVWRGETYYFSLLQYKHYMRLPQLLWENKHGFAVC